MDDVADVDIRRSVRLPRVTSAPAADLFSTAEVRPTAARETLGDPVVPEPEQQPVSTAVVWDTPRHAEGRRPRTGRVLVGTLVGAALLVAPLIVWSSQGRDHRAGSTAAKPEAGSPAVPSATPSSSADSTVTPNPTRTALRGHTGAGAKPGPAKSSGAAHPKFSVVAGPGCGGGGGYTRVGYYTDGKSGWLAGSDGYSGAGCDGRFDALPMSGTTTGDDPGLYARWTFDPGAHRQCAVTVYTPENGSKVYVGGSPAHFSVHQVTGGTSLAGFHIDQPASLGRWVGGPPFTAGGPFYVRLDNTGQDWSGDKQTYAHVAAAQVRATCA